MTHDTSTQLIVGTVVGSVMMTLLWLLQRRTKNAAVIDVGWTLGIGLMAIYLAASTPGPPLQRWLVGTLAGVWSGRLAIHLIVNRVVGKPEDGRYQRLRRNWGERAGLYFWLFFQAQVLLVLVFMPPFFAALRVPRETWSLWDVLAIVVWLVAIGGESLADRQLARFRARPESHGKTCRAGLWRYSRHPNYFFEWLHWWTYVLLAVGSPLWWLSLIAPALMLFFLFKVTGIPATEAQAVASRGEDYRRYQRTTSPFVPWFPRKEPA